MYHLAPPQKLHLGVEFRFFIPTLFGKAKALFQADLGTVVFAHKDVRERHHIVSPCFFGLVPVEVLVRSLKKRQGVFIQALIIQHLPDMVLRLRQCKAVGGENSIVLGLLERLHGGILIAGVLLHIAVEECSLGCLV